jgi:transposase
VNKEGEKLVHRKLDNDSNLFLRIIKPYKDDPVVSAESTSNWYWFADLCQDNGVEFVLGHALYMKAIHGGKAKNDRIDSEKIARLTLSGMLPVAYVCPGELRGLRDLLRRRLKFVRIRAGLKAPACVMRGPCSLQF